MEKLIIGSHVSYTKEEGMLGSVKEALSYKENTFMFYTGAPQNTFRTKIDEDKVKKAKELMKENDIDINNVIIHAPYIINLANDKDKDKYNFAINFLKEELKRAKILGIKNIVLHPGSHVGLGVEKGIQNIINALNEVFLGLKLLQYRGYDSCGIAYYTNKFNIIKAVGTLENLTPSIEKIKKAPHIAFAHTRWATNGEVNLSNTHPHISSSKDISLVHNGIITNSDEIKKDLIN